MLTYIIRRLLIMVPTLFGVTVVSFVIMQLAPGDPVMYQLQGGSAGKSNQTREAYLIQKRDLHLDKPWVLNFRYFRDYSTAVHWAAYYRGRTVDEILSEMPQLAEHPDDPANASRLDFLRSQKIPDFDGRLADREQWESLAKSIEHYVLVFSEDLGANGVSDAITILQDPKSDLKLKIGAIRCLNAMVVYPFAYTYSVHPSDAETPAVTAVWRIWWEQHKASLPEVDPEARKYLDGKMPEMAGDHTKIDAGLEQIVNGDYADVAPRYFAEKLLNAATPLDEKFVASIYLRRVFSEPLKLDVATDATAADVAQAAANWLEHYQLHQAEYEPSTLTKLWYIIGDTQYSHMIARLVTFDFGHSMLKTHDLVSDCIWDAFLVSAPLMFMSELLIYIVAVPLGILCGVFRNGWTDRVISFGLFLLYSMPGFVAAMLFLVFLCYGDYFQWLQGRVSWFPFPTQGLHSDNASSMSWTAYLSDYLWHAILPVICLSLFSLAATAMYSRSAILDVINQDYIRTARAKGLPGSKVILKHALRNGLIPILTLFSSFLPAMLGGSVLVEQIFDIPGLGRLGWSSIFQKDYTTQMALIYVEAIVTLVSFLITDLLYVVVDPRISFEGRGQAA
jgi:ABC-type dipeptide/oligopeptide/nickel transport system permease component